MKLSDYVHQEGTIQIAIYRSNNVHSLMDKLKDIVDGMVLFINSEIPIPIGWSEGLAAISEQILSGGSDEERKYLDKSLRRINDSVAEMFIKRRNK